MIYKFQQLIKNNNLFQKNCLNLVPSENFAYKSVLSLLNNKYLNNKYAEGRVNARYYPGCKWIDYIEQYTIDACKKAFQMNYANVQPHSGTQSNMIVISALLNPQDTLLTLNLFDGGHLSHCQKMNVLSKFYNNINYRLTNDYKIDYETIATLIRENKPKMLIAGFSSYTYNIDFQYLHTLCKQYKTILVADVAHISGIMVTQSVEKKYNPIFHSDIILGTTHKMLKGPRGGFITTNSVDFIKKINQATFPGMQGGPFMNNIAAKYICFTKSLSPKYKQYVKKVLLTTKIMCDIFKNYNCHVIGTNNHMFLLDVYSSFGITGEKASILLEKYNILSNKNILPDDTSVLYPHGLRIGTPCIVSRGISILNCQVLAKLIYKILLEHKQIEINKNLKTQVKKILLSLKR